MIRRHFAGQPQDADDLRRLDPQLLKALGLLDEERAPDVPMATASAIQQDVGVQDSVRRMPARREPPQRQTTRDVTQSGDVTQSSPNVTQDVQDSQDDQDDKERTALASVTSSRGHRTSAASARQRSQGHDWSAGTDAPALQALIRDLADHPPQGTGNMAFKLARRMQAAPEFRALGAGEVMERLDAANERWWALFADTREGRDGFIEDFAYAWRKVRHPEGDSLLRSALAAAERRPLTLLTPGPKSRRFLRFLAFVVELAAARGKNRVHLSCRKVADLLGGVTWKTVHRWRDEAVALGLMREVLRGDLASGLASVFEVDLSRFDELTRRVEATDGGAHGE